MNITGNISSIETMGLIDGPGIRFVVFMQGCALRCKYCHNPETWGVGQKKTLITPTDLVEKIKKYKNYFGDDGGVTFSGGEPLLQPDFLIECLKLCKEENINTAIDTAGVGLGRYDEILKFTDLVILDIKGVDPKQYRDITGFENAKYLKFLDACIKNKKRLWLRQVIVPGINDNQQSILELKNFAKTIPGVEKIELLPYKTIGVQKYKELNIAYPLEDIPDMPEEKCQELQKILEE